MAFELVRSRHGDVLVLAPRGRLDNDSAAEFELAVQEVVAAGERHVVVDCEGLTYSSNAGLRVFGKLSKALRTPTTSLRLCSLSPTLRQVFEQAGIAMVFDLRRDLDHALGDHPAARGAQELGREAARLLGVPPAETPSEPTPESIKTLATLATELLAGNSSLARAAKPLVDATQLTPKVRPEDIARVRAQQAAEAKKPGFWQRLFGRK